MIPESFRNENRNQNGNDSGTNRERFETSRTPADLGIKGTRDQGIKGSDQGAKQPNSTTDRLAGFRNARDETANLLDDRCWIAGYRINWTNSTVTLGSLIKPVTDVLKRKTWATMIRDEGWAFPLRYLAHVEKLLAGADVPVELFNVDGQPTPGQRERERSAERAEARGVLAEIRAAAKASHSDTVAVNAARLEARRAFAEAISRTKTAEADEAAS